MCCGQKRTAMRRIANSSTQDNPATPMAMNGKPMSRVALRYIDNSSVKVKGPATGREYDFSSTQPTQNVDPRDARLLVRSRFFRQR
jgi:hypothetical protein